MTEDFVRKTIKLNKKLWDEFQSKIEEEYGTTYKHTSEEMEKAIENYVNNDVLDIEKTKTKINNLNDENNNLKILCEKLEEENKKLSDDLLSARASNKKSADLINQHKQDVLRLENDKKLLETSVRNLEKEVNSLSESNAGLEDRNKELIRENKELESKYIEQVEETNRQVKENTKIKNKREHAQERLNKTQDELNDTLKRLEKYSFAIGQVKNMGFIDRLFNRLPAEIKELQPGKEEGDVED